MTGARRGAPLGPERVAAATLACLPDVTPARLHALLVTFGAAGPALAAVRRGHAEDATAPGAVIEAELASRWARAADIDRTRALLERRGTRVWLPADADYPIDDLPGRPAVLFAEGEVDDALARRRVAVVGTRSASPHGLADAEELGGVLADAGVSVVSGMALGVDGAAHRGALAHGGTPVGVVATGLDVEYPRRHRELYADVRQRGLLLGEAGFGAGPLPGRFPVRNRIIAALAEVVVVVEATVSGGARITAERALDYGRPVFALPGSRRNPAAAGCNALLADGAHPLVELDDVLVALGLTEGAHRARAAERPTPLVGDAAELLATLGGEPATNDELLVRTGWSRNRLALALTDLETARAAHRAHGRWWPI